MAESPQSQAVVVLDASELAAAKVIAADHGVAADDVVMRGIEPLTTATLVLLGAPAAVGIVLHLLDRRKGGQVIDLRPGSPKAFYRTPDVVFGTVVIVTVDGKVTVEVKEPDGMFGKVIALLPELVSAGTGAGEVAQAVSEAFDAGVGVTVVEIPVDGGADRGTP